MTTFIRGRHHIGVAFFLNVNFHEWSATRQLAEGGGGMHGYHGSGLRPPPFALISRAVGALIP